MDLITSILYNKLNIVQFKKNKFCNSRRKSKLLRFLFNISFSRNFQEFLFTLLEKSGYTEGIASDFIRRMRKEEK